MSTKNISSDYTITNHASALSDRVGATSIPFRLSVKGAPNLRNQSVLKHYETFIGEQRT
jgi:hypothetical protein